MRRLPPLREPPDCADFMRSFGMEPDPWQVDFFRCADRQVLMNCCRQSGKSTVVAVLALIEAVYKPMSNVMIAAPSQRQSSELLGRIAFMLRVLGDTLKQKASKDTIEFSNCSKIHAFPCKEATIRGFSAADILILDEAARLPEDIYRAVRPMAAIRKGRILCLSTPFGKRGFFWKAWKHGGSHWKRIEVPATQCPRIAADFLELERIEQGEAWYRQEYFCSFEALEGLVYPDFNRCVVDALPAHVPDLANLPAGTNVNTEHWVGGIDFGHRNPFAAVWGYLDRDDILWLMGERYVRETPMSENAKSLPRNVMWYADPSGASEISQLQSAGLMLRKGNNALRPGIAAVAARLRDGSLRVLKDRCPNLLAEAELYRYGDKPSECHREAPLSQDNHAMDALRYMIARVDANRMARQEARKPPVENGKLDMEDERYWAPFDTFPASPI